MKIIKPSAEIVTPLNAEAVIRHIERCGRVCYKSEESISEESGKRFIANVLKRGHESVIEHFSVTVKFTVDRGVSHEIVRHRLASYSQESTRYCNYSQGKFGSELTFIKPCFWDEGSELYESWKLAMEALEKTYLIMIAGGASPQEARSVLPNSLKTEVVMTANLREWRWFFRKRTAPDAHPQMREVAIPLMQTFQQYIPGMFDDIPLEI